MKQQKLLLPYHGRTIIETTIGNVLASDVDGIMVVLGASRDEILNVIGKMPVEHCHNADYELGMLSSVICGLRALPGDTDAALIFPGDQPDIPPGVINKLIRTFHRSSRGIVIPKHHNRRGHPLVVDMKYRHEIEHLNPEKGLRSLMELFPDDVLEVEVDEPGILKDIDTREDYLNATK